MLSEKLDRAEERLEKKIDAIAADLTAHRADTEGHGKGYMVGNRKIKISEVEPCRFWRESC